ncbi:hypothetical protein EBE87_19420 [Pseudoroseomonas wenyumeiae]|uniref:Uncharacterized protein n=1 Tax=Teichococcus wenyumeiae TaxID=2478470 RepID=A0A3A9JX95_9PROT|nr:hypothetical protein [Pseudoroseomonas wenyumeiae]RKK05418.1 hypothetical protein D6Z83_04205 [Pseudoroseomonas wenyumeiae]RMI19645.1 hypothetical protein EBE87_19420 [Pseudoroseomonas wenyumeiae]
MAGTGSDIRVNRAPVLTLWAAVVAMRLGHDWDAAITLGRAVAGSSARVKAKAIGIAEDRPESGGLRDEADKLRQNRAPARNTVHLLGRDLPVVEEKGKIRALDHDKPAAPRAAASYVERALGKDLPTVRQAMEDLARSMPPEELNRIGFRLYETFRPEVPPGARGWGAKGVLDLERIRTAAG